MTHHFFPPLPSPQVFATHILSLKDRIHPSNNQLHIKQRQQQQQHKVQSKIVIKILKVLKQQHDHHHKFLKRNFGDFDDKLMNHISPIASLMCRRQCMLIELKELTAWLNVKRQQQLLQHQHQQELHLQLLQHPRRLQLAFYDRNQFLKQKQQLHRNVVKRNYNAINNDKHSLSTIIDYRKEKKPRKKYYVQRDDIAATWSKKKNNYSVYVWNFHHHFYYSSSHGTHVFIFIRGFPLYLWIKPLITRHFDAISSRNSICSNAVTATTSLSIFW